MYLGSRTFVPHFKFQLYTRLFSALHAPISSAWCSGVGASRALMRPCPARRQRRLGRIPRPPDIWSDRADSESRERPLPRAPGPPGPEGHSRLLLPRLSRRSRRPARHACAIGARSHVAVRALPPLLPPLPRRPLRPLPFPTRRPPCPACPCPRLGASSPGAPLRVRSGDRDPFAARVRFRAPFSGRVAELHSGCLWRSFLAQWLGWLRRRRGCRRRPPQVCGAPHLNEIPRTGVSARLLGAGHSASVC